MASAAIPDRFEVDILRLGSEGKTVRQIADWLAEQGFPASKSLVARRLKRLRTQRAEITKAVTVEHLGKSVVSDLDRLSEIRAEVAARAADCLEDKDWARLKDLEVRILDRKLHYSGAGTPDESAGSTLAGLFAQLERR